MGFQPWAIEFVAEPAIEVSNLLTMGKSTSDVDFYQEDRMQLSDNFSYSTGGHQLKAGADYNRLRDKDRWALAGDQLFVDFDLSAANVPPGTYLAIGSAVVEVSEEPHTGCGKFLSRFGLEAQKFVNSPVGRELGLRGINARVVQAGRIRVGDVVKKAETPR